MPSIIYLKKISSRRWCLLRLGLVKIWFFVQKSCYFCNSKHFCQSIMRPCYSCYFCVFYIFKFFQTIIVSLFLAGHDQYLKHSNVFELINFSFQTKYNNTIAFLLIAIIYSRGEKKEKNNCWNNSLIKSTVYE